MNECSNIKLQIDIEESIKSFYILKGIFSFLSEKEKLNIIIYNKNLQKKFDISIEDYKKVSGRYKEVEKDGTEKDITKKVLMILKLKMEMEKVKNIMKMVKQNMKENI